MDNVSDWIFPSDETIPVAVVGGLLAVFLFLSFDIRRMLTSSESKQRPEDNPGPEADQRDSTRTKAAQQAAAKAKASEERAARQQEAAQKAAAQKVVADKIATEMAAQEAARAAAAAAAAAATPAPAKLALDTSNDGVLSALMCGGFDDALVSDVEGRQIHCNDTLQSRVDQSYGSIDVKHDISQMLRVFRSKQPSATLAGVVYVLQGERDKSVGGTILMLGKDTKSAARLAALYTPQRIVCGTYTFSSAEKEEPLLSVISDLRSALVKK